jgi:hypothetical protein
VRQLAAGAGAAARARRHPAHVEAAAAVGSHPVVLGADGGSAAAVPRSPSRPSSGQREAPAASERPQRRAADDASIPVVTVGLRDGLLPPSSSRCAALLFNRQCQWVARTSAEIRIRAD